MWVSLGRIGIICCIGMNRSLVRIGCCRRGTMLLRIGCRMRWTLEGLGRKIRTLYCYLAFTDIKIHIV